jgi:uncharacterized Zn finger protein
MARGGRRGRGGRRWRRRGRGPAASPEAASPQAPPTGSTDSVAAGASGPSPHPPEEAPGASGHSTGFTDSPRASEPPGADRAPGRPEPTPRREPGADAPAGRRADPPGRRGQPSGRRGEHHGRRPWPRDPRGGNVARPRPRWYDETSRQPFFPPREPLLPAPEHGIRVKEIGATWWGARWVEALSRFGGGYAGRLRRGVSYARQGRVHDLAVRDAVVTAEVTGSRPEPYKVSLMLRPLPERAWDLAIRAMAGKARFSAQLLAGDMPRAIDEAFSVAHVSLFPARRADLRTDCSCPDSANPCKHVAALHYVLGEAFDRDPFLLFELRGRSKDSVLGELRARRAQMSADRRRAAERASAARGEGAASEAPGADDVLDDVDSAPAAAGYDEFRAPVDDLRFRITAPAAEGAILRQLGSPPAWSLDARFAELVQPGIARAAHLAREIGLATPPVEEAPARPAPRGAAKYSLRPRQR